MKKEKTLRIKKISKGITLVALVVTIVVLIILATISVNIIFGDEGILERARLAKQDYANAEVEEQQILSDTSNSIEEYVTGEREKITVDKDEYKELLNRVTELEKRGIETLYDSGFIGTSGAEITLTKDVQEFDMILVVARRNTGTTPEYHTSTLYLPEYMSDIEKTIVNIANKDTNYIIGFKIDANKLTLTQVSAALGIVSVYGINL